MTLMQWDDTMSVGVEELDDQHKQIINIINDAYEAIQKHDEHRMPELIDKMQEYSSVHFATEEKYLKKYNFPELQGHKFLHVKFNRDVAEFRKNLFETTNFSQIFVYLSRWLTNHIMEEDMKYVPYMPKPEDEEK